MKQDIQQEIEIDGFKIVQVARETPFGWMALRNGEYLGPYSSLEQLSRALIFGARFAKELAGLPSRPGKLRPCEYQRDLRARKDNAARQSRLEIMWSSL